MSESGKLYIVATPIGNLEDITLRAIKILREADLIAAEDTRRTRKLLGAYDIRATVISLHEHNEADKIPSLIDKIAGGLSVAYVSDAGTPGLSDPGFRLIRAAIAREVVVTPIPGVSALITALSASGFSMHRFLFHGFLPVKTSGRRQRLAELKDETGALIFYESPNRLTAALGDVFEILGNRDVVICRELTKIHESFLRGTAAELLEVLAGRRLKGEITLLVSGCQENKPHWSDADILKRFKQLLQDTSLSHRDSVDQIALETGVSRSRIYRLTVTKITGGSA